MVLRLALASFVCAVCAAPSHADGVPTSSLVLGVATDYAVAALHDPTRGSLQLGRVDGSLRWTPRHNYYVGDPIVAIDGGAGWASDGAVPFAVSARIGTEMEWFPGELVGDCDPCRAHRTGALAGLRLDAVGDRVPSAWTVPVDAYWYLPGVRVRWGLDGGVRVRVAGADRAFGWSGGADLVARGVFGGTSPIAPRDLSVRVGVERLDDATMIGVSIGISSSDRYDPARHPGV